MKGTGGLSGSRRRRGAPGNKALLWVLPGLWLLLAIAGVFLVVASWSWIPYVATAALVLVAFTWIMVSTLSPAVPDRTCPQCGGEGLVKIRRGELGVRCELCDYRDETGHVAYLDEW